MWLWDDFDRDEVQLDFETLAAASFDYVRVFLLWEAFQPTPAKVSRNALRALTSLLDVAASCEIKVQITFFTGHMSGANWLPEFLTKRTTGTSRFPMITSGRITRWEALDLFGDSDAILAQARMLRAVVSAVHDHGALWSWDLGNETSNV